MAREELRVSIIIKGDRAFIGATATDCDPKMITVQGNLQAALERIPSFVEEANREWDTAPRNPKSAIPAPAPPKPAARPATPSKTATGVTPAAAAKPAAPSPQPRMF